MSSLLSQYYLCNQCLRLYNRSSPHHSIISKQYLSESGISERFLVDANCNWPLFEQHNIQQNIVLQKYLPLIDSYHMSGVILSFNCFNSNAHAPISTLICILCTFVIIVYNFINIQALCICVRSLHHSYIRNNRNMNSGTHAACVNASRLIVVRKNCIQITNIKYLFSRL